MSDMRTELTPIERLVLDTIKDSVNCMDAESIAFAIEGDDYRKSTVKVVKRALDNLWDLDLLAITMNGDGQWVYSYDSLDEPSGGGTLPEEDEAEAKEEYVTGEDGKHYRMLKKGETIRKLDQMQIGDEWVEQCLWKTGATVQFAKIRRAVDSVPSTPLSRLGTGYIVEGSKAYRVLREDEKVIKGDECFIEDMDEWEPSCNWGLSGVMGGKQSEGMLYRRPIEELPFGIGPIEALAKAIHGKYPSKQAATDS